MHKIIDILVKCSFLYDMTISWLRQALKRSMIWQGMHQRYWIRSSWSSRGSCWPNEMGRNFEAERFQQSRSTTKIQGFRYVENPNLLSWFRTKLSQILVNPQQNAIQIQFEILLFTPLLQDLLSSSSWQCEILWMEIVVGKIHSWS